MSTPPRQRSYLRFPHLHGPSDTVVFTAEDDVWTAPLSGGRAYRLTADDVAVASPRLSPDGTLVAWTSWREGAPEAFVTEAQGGRSRRLTYWGDLRARTVGWTPGGDVLVVSAAGEPSRRTWAYAVPPDGGTPRRLPYGPVSDLALAADVASGAAGPAILLGTTMSRDMAWWKRYRGGTAGKLWWDATGAGEFVRLAAELAGQIDSPMLVAGRIAFLSDHEGWGNLYSLASDGTDLRRHSDHGSGDHGSGDHGSGDHGSGDHGSGDHGSGAVPAFYARHASTDGVHVVYESAGELWVVDSLDPGVVPRRLDIRLGGPRTDRLPFRASTARWLTAAAPDRSGRTSIALVRGTVHRLTHRDGPARTLLAEPGVRARLAQPLGADRAVCVAPLDSRARQQPAGSSGPAVSSPEQGSVCGAAREEGSSAGAAPEQGSSAGAAREQGSSAGAAREQGSSAGAAREQGFLGGAAREQGSSAGAAPEEGSSAGAAPEQGSSAGAAPEEGSSAEAGEPAKLLRYGAGEIGRVLELAAAPDASAVALAVHDGRLLVLDIATGALRQLARGADGEISGLAWSPDSAWLAYCDPVESGMSRIMMVRLTDDTRVAVTEPRFADEDPVFTTDGKYLAFLSRRSFDPIYDQHSFDLTFPASWRPFLVPLAARTPSPFGASPDGRPTSPEEEGPEDLPAPEPDDPSAPDASGAADTAALAATVADPEGKKKDSPPEVVVDIESLSARVVPIPVIEGRYSGMGAGKDCLLWFRSPVLGVLGDGRAGTEEKAARPVLERYDLVRRKLDVIADPISGYEVSGDGTRLVVRDGATLRVLRTDRSGSGAPSETDADEFDIDTSRIVVTVDPAAEWRQMFDEAGRLMRDHFWVEDMAGVDWAAEMDRYRPLVDAVGSHDDLVDLLWELQGELGTSHAYVSGGGGGGDWSGRPGLLGADLEPAPDGWRVARVLPPETSAPAARSPLTGPGVDVRTGDVVLEVGGRPVDPALGPAPMLVGTAEKLVELTVRTGPDREGAGEVRRVVVRPLRDEGALRYQDWVAGRRAFVADRSEGRLGYLHVPDMMAPGWAQLHRDLGRETARDGLILDVRGNRGGHTSQLVVEKLARKVIGWDVIRHRQPITYPYDAPRGPVVALADELSGSDGDIVTAAIKRMGIGPVVGVRTWGGVIGIDSRYELVDGTRVTQPRYASWFDDSGWAVENYGVDPDVEVVIAPQDWVAGRDPQLERAVDIALAALDERPAARPPDPATRPSRARSPLPPRPPAPVARESG